MCSHTQCIRKMSGLDDNEKVINPQAFFVLLSALSYYMEAQRCVGFVLVSYLLPLSTLAALCHRTL